jgi:hypothetical protein
VKMIPDRTGRFRERPYYELSELEERSEQAITAFLRQRYGFDRIPVPTEAFTVLIERDATDLDLSVLCRTRSMTFSGSHTFCAVRSRTSGYCANSGNKAGGSIA